MEAKDLMIGDWVNIYVFPNENPQKEDLFPARISTIMTPLPSEDSGEHCECQFVATDGGVGCASRPIETCLPIPLTPEILEKNGFAYGKKGREYTLSDDYYDIIVAEWSGSIWVIRYECTEMVAPHHQTTFSYIHEFQHFLKECGLSEMAENIKVE